MMAITQGAAKRISVCYFCISAIALCFSTHSAMAGPPQANARPNVAGNGLKKIVFRRPPTILDFHLPSLARVTLSPDGSLLAASDSDGGIEIWGKKTGAWAHLTSFRPCTCFAEIFITGDNTRLAMLRRAMDGPRLLQVTFGAKPEKILVQSRKDPYTDLVMAPDGRTFAAIATAGREIHVWKDCDITTKPIVLPLKDVAGRFAFAEGSERLVAESSQRGPSIWNTNYVPCSELAVLNVKAQHTTPFYIPKGKPELEWHCSSLKQTAAGKEMLAEYTVRDEKVMDANYLVTRYTLTTGDRQSWKLNTHRRHEGSMLLGKLKCLVTYTTTGPMELWDVESAARIDTLDINDNIWASFVNAVSANERIMAFITEDYRRVVVVELEGQ